MGVLPELTAPRVVLHGVRLMSDGSMLLLFLEAGDGTEGSMDAVRKVCADVAAAAGQGDQPVRPKHFLHVVVGRILEAQGLQGSTCGSGDASGEAEREALFETAKAEALALEGWTGCLAGKPASEHQLDLPCLTLVRDRQWFHLDYDVLGSYMLRTQT
eukprot:gnl/TRDRNA2_/TRDRNA2_127030_c0_seq2.p1 gnl/TRDRNA2_/TRDRNA2_127030_c0~~gnl/TRDRNA2_/TRDRNA2_127030_c0_seq2.p1  ORF type:complete len:158 (-),score=26.50 gnl/TRDRNA2_/TRDRNA2_127030_c0_seq2:29-502(-)